MFYLKKCWNFLEKVSVGALLLSSTKGLEAGWTTPAQISSSTSDQVNIAVDISGNAVAVWQGYDGSNYIIQSASMPMGGSWSSPTTLSDTGQDAQGPRVGVDHLGNAVSIWSRYDGTNSIIQASNLTFGGSWTAPVNISTAGGNADSPKLSMDFSGNAANAIAVWHRFNGSNFIIQSSELPSGGDWSSPSNISPSGQDALIPNVAVDPNGNAIAICARYNGTNFTSHSAIHFNNDSWGPSFVVSDSNQSASDGNVAVDSSGNGMVVWTQFDGSNYVTQASYVPYGSNWSAPQTISTVGQNSFIPLVVLDPNGNSVAMWITFDGSNYVAQAVNTLSDGSWTTPVNISNPGVNVTNISLTIDTAGYVVALWDETDGVNSVIQSGTLPFGGTWSTPTQVSTSGNFAYLPSVGVDQNGNAVAIWLQLDGSSNYYVWGSSLPFGT